MRSISVIITYYTFLLLKNTYSKMYITNHYFKMRSDMAKMRSANNNPCLKVKLIFSNVFVNA